MKTYLFLGKKIRARSKDEILRWNKLNIASPKYRAMIVKIKAKGKE